MSLVAPDACLTRARFRRTSPRWVDSYASSPEFGDKSVELTEFGVGQVAALQLRNAGLRDAHKAVTSAGRA